jgi:agmatinase
MLKPVLQSFLDKPPSSEDSDYKLFSAPLDLTTSYRRGTRFGPSAIRRESSYLDTYSERTGLDWEDINLADVGEVECPTVEEALDNIEKTVKPMRAIPVILGGEHTITLGALKALKPDLIIVFDAHLDIRDQLFDKKLCHATYLRRAYEELKCEILVLGPRALSKEEVDFANVHKDIRWFSSGKIVEEENYVINQVLDTINEANSFYLSLDMDALDPSYAPGVGNPYPEGLSVSNMMNIINANVNEKLVGLDLVEIYPGYDTGLTAITGAYILMETLFSHIHNTKNSPS